MKYCFLLYIYINDIYIYINEKNIYIYIVYVYIHENPEVRGFLMGFNVMYKPSTSARASAGCWAMESMEVQLSAMGNPYGKRGRI